MREMFTDSDNFGVSCKYIAQMIKITMSCFALQRIISNSFHLLLYFVSVNNGRIKMSFPCF